MNSDHAFIVAVAASFCFAGFCLGFSFGLREYARRGRKPVPVVFVHPTDGGDLYLCEVDGPQRITVTKVGERR